MIYSDMHTPSKNMRLSNTEISKKITVNTNNTSLRRRGPQ